MGMTFARLVDRHRMPSLLTSATSRQADTQIRVHIYFFHSISFRLNYTFLVNQGYRKDAQSVREDTFATVIEQSSSMAERTFSGATE